MLFNVIVDKPNVEIKDVMLKMATLSFPISHSTVKCIDDDYKDLLGNEEFDDEMWFVGINGLDQLLVLVSHMDEFEFSIIPRRNDSMDDWGFRLKDKKDENLYRYPILWLS